MHIGRQNKMTMSQNEFLVSKTRPQGILADDPFFSSNHVGAVSKNYVHMHC